MDQRLIIAVLCLLLSPGMLGQTARTKQRPVSSGSTGKAIEKLVDEYTEAAKKGDVAFLGRNLARDYIGIEADGHMSTKPEVLELYRAGQVKFESLEVKDRRARVYGIVAVVISELAIQGHSGREELRGTYRSTCVLKKTQGGQWQLVNSQLTKLQ